MLSSDKNVETIGQLAEIVKHYLGLQAEYLKLDIVEKLVRLLTLFALAIIFILIAIAIVAYFSLAFTFWLAAYTGMATAFLIVGGIHVLLLIVIFCNSKTWIEKPLVRFLANLFLNNK